MSAPTRDVREIIREEPLVRGRILDALTDGPLTVPEIAAAIGEPEDEVMFWVMGMRKYGRLAELPDVTPDGYYRFQATGGSS
jgi:predicted Rossmann fold nucleotide-binding protein DprA/Smf involved in DNA uptake